MRADRVDSLIRPTLVAGALIWMASLPAFGFDSTVERPMRVVVCADHYIVAGEKVSDLNALEDQAKRMGTDGLRFETSGPGSSRKLLDAVERFHLARAAEFDIRPLQGGDRQCPDVGAFPSVHEFLATDQHGRSNMP